MYLGFLKSAFLSVLCPPRQLGWSGPHMMLTGGLQPALRTPAPIAARCSADSVRPASALDMAARCSGGETLPSVVGFPLRAAEIFARAASDLDGLLWMFVHV